MQQRQSNPLNRSRIPLRGVQVYPDRPRASQTDFDALAAAVSDLTTDDVAEGVTNLYFTQSRARTSLSADTTLSYDNVTGIISAGAVLSAYAGGATPSAFTLSIVNSASGATWRAALGVGTGGTLDYDNDSTLAANSSALLPTQAAVKAYIDAKVVGLLEYIGGIDASADPDYPAGLKGDSYAITASGKIGGGSGKPVDVGDFLICSADNAGGTEASVGANWYVLEHNLQGALLSASNLSDVVDPATARSNLGLTIGTNVQAWDADLDALSALSGTNTIYYRSGAGAWSAVSMGSDLSFSGGTLSLAAGTGSGSLARATRPQFTDTIGVGTAPSASGSGVSFPATQSPSTDPNTLDDYEEGTWTPTVTAGSGSISSYSATGTYTKIGRMVFCSVTITITANGTGAVSVKFTLPFSIAGGDYVGHGRENAISGAGLQVLGPAGESGATVFTYANGYPATDGSVIIASLAYSV
ncbi:hypothetical protein [Novosphingobium pentaromativorans]|uniref:Uncharacterized protein n=1 Tax=Novosphingobium pentaromativorans US6-1 TaxID=1088721 RepID=G6E8U6_9SPHN|nr:hypothetical protein [Novosphingobium pentaromativorans]AIT81221.1 hypothetical protein JI59_16250 [Novosphingobium pentaromativorans US6-1]EHJ62170.1 hypothetical protein NSU_0767 [Novosphingobium pentaromativorans US6-1]